MKKTNTYTQCYLSRGTISRIGWIPSEFAEKNRMVDLKLNDTWSKGWKVINIMSVAPAEYVEAREMDYKKQRKASDI